jgi:hypothetical protein
MPDRQRENEQVLVFGDFTGRVRRGAAALAAEQRVQLQLVALVQENAELRRMYKHMETQLTFAAEELSGEHWPAISCQHAKHFGLLLLQFV